MSPTETLTRDPVITARIRACKTVIKREAAAQADLKKSLHRPHGPDAGELMYAFHVRRYRISALLDEYLTLRGKQPGHLRGFSPVALERLRASARQVIDAAVPA
jgi:hypothetical protein